MPAAPAPDPFETDLRARVDAAARNAVRHAVKSRARRYARRPPGLEALFPGLSTAPPATLIAVAEHLIETGCRSPARWFGFGGEVPLLNARAALLLGRALRRRGANPLPEGEGWSRSDRVRGCHLGIWLPSRHARPAS